MVATDEKFLTVKNLVELLQVSRPQIYRLVELGILPKGNKLGRSRRWLKSEIDAFMRKQATSN